MFEEGWQSLKLLEINLSQFFNNPHMKQSNQTVFTSSLSFY